METQSEHAAAALAARAGGQWEGALSSGHRRANPSGAEEGEPIRRRAASVTQPWDVFKPQPEAETGRELRLAGGDEAACRGPIAKRGATGAPAPDGARLLTSVGDGEGSAHAQRGRAPPLRRARGTRPLGSVLGAARKKT